MSHEVEVSGNAVIATVAGTLDGEGARALSSGLRAKGFSGASIVIEMSGVTSVDVEGITQIVALKRWAERENGRLVLAAPSYDVMDALRSNGLDRIFDTAPTREAAIGAAAEAHARAPAPPPPMVSDAESFTPAHPPVRMPEEPARRREPDDGEANEWVKPAAGAAKAERAAPPVTAAAPPPPHPPKKPKKSALPVLIVAVLLLAGGGTAAWFLLRKKPEVLPQEGEWSRVEGTDTEFEIKFRNASTLVLKDETLPEGLYLDTIVKDYADGLKSQNIKGDTRTTGTHSFSVTAKPAGDGDESPPVKFSFSITAEEVRNTSGGTLRELVVDVPLAAGVQELARGCVKATAEGLDDTGLSVNVDAARRVAHLTGTPKKAGEHKFNVKAANADGNSKSFDFAVTVKAPPAPIAVHAPALSTQQAEKPTPPTPTTPTPKPTPTPSTPTPTPTPTPPVTTPAVTTPPESLDPSMLAMLSDRIAKSRFPEAEKSQMRAAVNQVQSARRLATVKFAHGEKTIAADQRDKLVQALERMSDLKKEDQRALLDFVVIGYASRRGGTLAQNIAISKVRASSVEGVLKHEFGIHPKFTGDYGATDVLGPREEENRVVEVYAVKVKEETRDTLKRLIEDMKRISGSR